MRLFHVTVYYSMSGMPEYPAFDRVWARTKHHAIRSVIAEVRRLTATGEPVRITRTTAKIVDPEAGRKIVWLG